MGFDDLRETWQHANRDALSPEQREALAIRICRRVEQREAKVRHRDWRETIAVAVVLPIFFFAIWKFDELTASFLAKAGAAMTILSGIHIVYRLHHARMAQKPSALDASIRDFCQTELARLDRQIQLGKSILWWSILPTLGGAALWYVGVRGFGVSSIAYVALALVVGWGSYAWTQRDVAKSMVPLRAELEQLLVDMSEKK